MIKNGYALRTTIERANILQKRLNAELQKISEVFQYVLDEPDVYVFYQTDGMVLVHGADKNACIRFLPVTKIPYMTKEELLDALEEAGV